MTFCDLNCSCDSSTPICFTQGDTNVLYGTYADSNGNAINITGATIIMVCKTSHSAPDTSAIFNISTTTGDIKILSAAAGTFCVTIPSSATLNIAPQLFPAVYQIVIEIGSAGTGYSGSLGFSGFSGLSGNGLYRVTAFKGVISLLKNTLDS